MTDINKFKIKPKRVSIDSKGTGMPGFEKQTTTLPAKEVANTRNSMDYLDLFLHGPMKFQDIGAVCGSCVNFYKDKTLEVSTSERVHLDSEEKTKDITRSKTKVGRGWGRCKAKGYMVVHEETAADERKEYTHPSGISFKVWPACPYFVSAGKLSKR